MIMKRSHKGEEKAHDNRVEVVVHQNANKEAAKEAIEINKKVNKLLTQNGFTLKIYLAIGGQKHHNGTAK